MHRSCAFPSYEVGRSLLRVFGCPERKPFTTSGGAVLLVLLTSSSAFLLTRVAPGDYASDLVAGGASREAVARERARYGLDRRWVAQYGDWLERAARLERP